MTQEMVLRGLMKASEEHKQGNSNACGVFTGTSNVHFAHRLDTTPPRAHKKLKLNIGSTWTLLARSPTSGSWV